jgi:hypothetical protein
MTERGTNGQGEPAPKEKLIVMLPTPTALWLVNRVAGFVNGLESGLETPMNVSLKGRSPLNRRASISGPSQAITRFAETLHDIAGVYREASGYEGATELSIEIALRNTLDLHRTRFQQGLES